MPEELVKLAWPIRSFCYGKANDGADIRGLPLQQGAFVHLEMTKSSGGTPICCVVKVSQPSSLPDSEPCVNLDLTYYGTLPKINSRPPLRVFEKEHVALIFHRDLAADATNSESYCRLALLMESNAHIAELVEHVSMICGYPSKPAASRVRGVPRSAGASNANGSTATQTHVSRASVQNRFSSQVDLFNTLSPGASQLSQLPFVRPNRRPDLGSTSGLSFQDVHANLLVDSPHHGPVEVDTALPSVNNPRPSLGTQSRIYKPSGDALLSQNRNESGQLRMDGARAQPDRYTAPSLQTQIPTSISSQSASREPAPNLYGMTSEELEELVGTVVREPGFADFMEKMKSLWSARQV